MRIKNNPKKWINKTIERFVWRPATPPLCRSWPRQTLTFILGRNHWLNMTGRKWESEAGDASRYCQITMRMRQISLFFHLVLVISLASFSSLILVLWRYVVGGSHQPCTYREEQWAASNSSVILNCPFLNINEFENESLQKARAKPKLFSRHFAMYNTKIFTVSAAVAVLFKHLWKLLLQHRWIYLRKWYCILLGKTIEGKLKKKRHHLHGSIKPLRLTAF